MSYMALQNQQLQQIDKYIYQPEEIKNFRLDEAVNEHPLKRRPINLRSRLAYREILRQLLSIFFQAKQLFLHIYLKQQKIWNIMTKLL